MLTIRASTACPVAEAVEVGAGDSEGEEEAWLVAMEKGQLDNTGYLPRKPGTTLTARQVRPTPVPFLDCCL